MTQPEKTYKVEFRVVMEVDYKASVADVGKLLDQELEGLNLDDHIARVDEINTHGMPTPLLSPLPEALTPESVKYEFRGLTCPEHGLTAHSRPRRAAVRDRATANVSEQPQPWMCARCLEKT
jgi:hypothetical protein